MSLSLKDALSPPLISPRAPAPTPGFSGAWEREWRAALAMVPSDASGGSLPQASLPRDQEELERCGVPSGVTVMVPGNAPDPVRAVAPAADSGSAPLDTAIAPRERTAVRVHVDSDAGSGLRIWLGIDALPQQASQAAGLALAHAREALQAAGHRIELFVCNGRALVAGAATKTDPRRSSTSIPNTNQESS